MNNPNATTKVLQMKNNLNLFDVWRDNNPEKLQYTWKRKLERGKTQMGRLDYFLISENLTDFVSEEKISPGYRSDHSIISVKFKFINSPRGKSFWKFNNSLIKDQTYVELVKSTILDTKIKYSPTPYVPENIYNIPDDAYQSILDDQLFFETLLLEIRSKTISFSSFKKKQENNTMEELIARIEKLETEDANIRDELESKKLELERYRHKRMEGVLVRSRARWVGEGEKLTKYFCNLENRNFSSKRMKVLLDNNNREITDNKQISKEVRKYYKNLYSSHEQDINHDICLSHLLHNDTPKLADEDNHNIQGLITLNEASNALKSMKNNKSPGSDGFTVEFF